MQLLVAADDRTGAYETAAVLADHGLGPVPAAAWPRRPDAAIGVIDLGSRHLSPADAAARSAGVTTDGALAHKIDSTLRGNWADELVALGAPVLLIPALPALGRTCRGGVVYEHGRPVHEGAAASDVRRRVATPRPADSLFAAGATDVCEIVGADEVARWLDAPRGIAVVDAASDDDIAASVDRWALRPDVVLAGTSATIGASGRALAATGGATAPTAPVIAPGPALVVCGSVHPAARRQLDVADRAGLAITTIADDISARRLTADGVLVLASEIPVGDVDEPVAVAAATNLTRGARDLAAAVPLAAMVVIGGDTAAAIIGDETVTVTGALDAGTAVIESDRWRCPIITRSGGFGSDRALVELLRAHTGWER